VRGDVWFVQRRRVEDGMHSQHATLDEVAIRDRPYLLGEGRFLDVNANYLLTRFE
jgi:hypothetical protein